MVSEKNNCVLNFLLITCVFFVEYYADPSNENYDNLQSIIRRLQNDNDGDVRFAINIENFSDSTEK